VARCYGAQQLPIEYMRLFKSKRRQGGGEEEDTDKDGVVGMRAEDEVKDAGCVDVGLGGGTGGGEEGLGELTSSVVVYGADTALRLYTVVAVGWVN